MPSPSPAPIPALTLAGGLTVRKYKEWRARMIRICPDHGRMILKADPTALIRGARKFVQSVRDGEPMILPPMTGTLKSAVADFRRAYGVTEKADPYWRPEATSL